MPCAERHEYGRVYCHIMSFYSSFGTSADVFVYPCMLLDALQPCTSAFSLLVIGDIQRAPWDRGDLPVKRLPVRPLHERKALPVRHRRAAESVRCVPCLWEAAEPCLEILGRQYSKLRDAGILRLLWCGRVGSTEGLSKHDCNGHITSASRLVERGWDTVPIRLELTSRGRKR